MKQRQGFVSNSSSSSFVVPTNVSKGISQVYRIINKDKKYEPLKIIEDKNDPYYYDWEKDR